MKLKEVIKDFKFHCEFEKNLSEKTMKAYEIDLKQFELYKNLNSISPNPYSGFYRLNDKWLICASPERFLHKKGNKIR